MFAANAGWFGDRKPNWAYGSPQARGWIGRWEQDMAELTHHDRALTLKTGQISYAGKSQPVVCAVLNFSRAGACILVADTADVPDDFTLILDVDRATVTCRVAWRTRTKLGVSFQRDPLVVGAAASEPT